MPLKIFICSKKAETTKELIAGPDSQQTKSATSAASDVSCSVSTKITRSFARLALKNFEDFKEGTEEPSLNSDHVNPRQGMISKVYLQIQTEKSNSQVNSIFPLTQESNGHNRCFDNCSKLQASKQFTKETSENSFSKSTMAESKPGIISNSSALYAVEFIFYHLFLMGRTF